MNRRTVLGSAGVLATVGLAGYLSNLENILDWEVQSPVPLEVSSDADRHYNVRIEAFERGTDRQTYDKSFTVTTQRMHSPAHLDGFEQDLHVTQLDGNEELYVEKSVITSDAQFVSVRVGDDDLDVTVHTQESPDGTEE